MDTRNKTEAHLYDFETPVQTKTESVISPELQLDLNDVESQIQDLGIHGTLSSDFDKDIDEFLNSYQSANLKQD